MFKVSDMLKKDTATNVYPLERDEMPTRPFTHAPEMPAQAKQPDPPIATLDPQILHEMIVAKEIFTELHNMDKAGRDRIMHMVSDYLRLYAKEEAEAEHPQGSPV